MRKKTMTALALTLILIFAFGCPKTPDQAQVEWKGTIEFEDGIKVVKNPEEPVFGEIVFDLEEDLSIGREDDDNYLFYRAMDIALDNEENIYILEYRNCRLQKFDKSGNYLQTIGRKGQGPGEFERPAEVCIDKTTENIYVKDGRKIKIFDSQGNYLRDILMKSYPYDIFLDSEGNIWGKFSVSQESGQAFSFDQVSPQGDILKNIVSFPSGATFTRSGSTTWGLSHGYMHDLIISKIHDQSFIYGYSKDYELHVINPLGEHLFKIRKAESYHPITEKEKEKIRGQFENVPEAVRKAIQFPEHRPFYASIFSDSQGRIYVHRMKSLLDEVEGIRFDVFNHEGYYLFQTTFQTWPELIENGCLYTITRSEETGEERIKRFRILNWKNIKDVV